MDDDDSADATRDPGLPERTSRGAKPWAQVGLLAIFIIATVWALWQPSAPELFTAPPASAFGRASLILQYPIETNRQLKLAVIPIDLNAVFFQPGGRVGWVAGENGYLAKSSDGGLSWERIRFDGNGGSLPAKMATRGFPFANAQAAEPSNAAQTKTSPLPPQKLAVTPGNAPRNPAGIGAPRNGAGPNSRSAEPIAPAQQSASKRPLGAETQSAGGSEPKSTPPVAPPPPANLDTVTFFGIHFIDENRGVVVGTASTILVTQNGGQTWQRSTISERGDFRAVTYNAGVWYALGDTSSARSVNLSDWSAADLAVGHSIAGDGDGTPTPAIARNAVVVAVGKAGIFWTRPNNPWLRGKVEPQAPLNSVAHQGSRWVAVGAAGSIYRADNAETWRAEKSGTNDELRQISADGRGNWLAIGNGSYLRSPDGIQWAVTPFSAARYVTALCFDGARWIGVGKSGLVIAIGVNTPPERLTSGPKAQMNAIASDGARWVAVGAEGLVSTSANGSSWHEVISGTDAPLTDVAYQADRFVAVGARGEIIRSSDGTAWLKSASNVDANSDFTQIVPNGASWLAPASTGVWTSDASAISWQRNETTGPITAPVVSIGMSNDLLLGVDGSEIILESADGRNWKPHATVSAARLVRIAAAKGHEIVLTDRGALWQTSGSTGWTTPDVTRNESLLAVANGNGRWVVVGNNGSIFSSDGDSRTWIKRPSATTLPLRAIHFNDNQWIVVGDGVFLSSSDGLSWKPARYARVPAGWYYLLCFCLLVGLPLGRRVNDAMAEHKTAMRPSVADQVVTDAPIRDVVDDKLRFGIRVDCLSRYLRNRATEPPLTLAINGPWGSGKTSFMRLLQSDLEQRGARTVWFNAWHQQKGESLQAALLLALRRQVPPPLLSPFGFEFRLRLFWNHTLAHPSKALLSLIAVVASVTYLFSVSNHEQTRGEELWTAVSCVLAPPKTSEAEDKISAAIEHLAATLSDTQVAATPPPGTPLPSDTSTPTTGINAQEADGQRCMETLRRDKTSHWLSQSWTSIFHGQLAAGLIVFLVGLVSAVKAVLALRAFGVDPFALRTLLGARPRQSPAETTTIRANFAADFAAVTTALAPRTLTIFIDDLDRCNETQAMEILEAVNYLVDAGPCFIVLGMVEETVQRLVGLAVERLAAELAEQDELTSSTERSSAESLEAAKRERRRRFAERYLEKLINIKASMPVLLPSVAGDLLQQNTSRPDESTKTRWQPPYWAQSLDNLIPVLRMLRLPALMIFAAIATYLLVTPFTATVSAPPTANDVGAPPPAQILPGPTTVPNLPGLTPAANFRPDFAAPPRRSLDIWPFGGIVIVAGILFAAVIVALVRRPDYNTRDSKQFADAFAIWTPFLLTRLNTPRALKRFQNRVRLQAMNLYAQAVPRLASPPRMGPVGHWLEAREQARLEAGQRSNAPLPEPYLVGLEALRAVFPDTFDESVDDHATLLRRLNDLQKNLAEAPAVQILAKAVAAQKKSNASDPASNRFIWPPGEAELRSLLDKREVESTIS